MQRKTLSPSKNSMMGAVGELCGLLVELGWMVVVCGSMSGATNGPSLCSEAVLVLVVRGEKGMEVAIGCFQRLMAWMWRGTARP